MGQTQTHVGHAVAAAPLPAVGSPFTASPPQAGRAGAIGFSIAAAALLLGGAAWFFSRGQTAGPLPAAAAPTPVVTAVAPTSVPSPSPTQAVPSRKSIAVLPFENLSGRPEDAYLADGLQEEILNALARLRDLKVISRTSVKEYRGKDLNIREIGQRLGVGTIVEGSVRREGNTLRLTVQLIDARDDQHLLAANYDRELNKVLDLQSAVARQVADALAATLTRQERGDLDRVATNNGDAYDRYLRAVAVFRRPTPDDRRGLIEPKRLLEEAIRLDPNFADAYALLSQAHTWTYLLAGQKAENDAAAKEAFEHAFANDPEMPEARLARGLYAIYASKNLDQALADLSAVVKLRPNSAEAHSALGYALRRSGRMDEALDHLLHATDLDPLNRAYSHGAVSTLVALRRYPEAIKQTELWSARLPNNAESYFVRAGIQAFLGQNTESLRAALRDRGTLLDPLARKTFEAELAQMEGRYLDAVKLWGDVPVDDEVDRSCRIGFLYYVAGDAARAEQSFLHAETSALELQQREPQRPDLGLLAIVQSMLGKHDAALASVELARAQTPEARDAVNGPLVSFVRSFILVRAGRTQEGYAEVARLLRVPFGSPNDVVGPQNPMLLVTKIDPHFDELVNHPPRL